MIRSSTSKYVFAIGLILMLVFALSAVLSSGTVEDTRCCQSLQEMRSGWVGCFTPRWVVVAGYLTHATALVVGLVGTFLFLVRRGTSDYST